MHRWFSTLAVISVAVHLAGLVADNYIHFDAADILIPMASDWKPVAVTFGTVAMYLFALIHVSSLMMRKLPKKLWRTIHMASYLMVWLVFIHAGLAGSDVSNRVYQIVALTSAVFATSAAVLRVTFGRAKKNRPTST